MESFVVVSGEPGFVHPAVVVQRNPAAGTGICWAEAQAAPIAVYDTDAAKLRDAVEYVREGVRAITGVQLTVTCSADLSHGIVFTTLAGATEDIRNDPAVQAALANPDPLGDPWGAEEAYLVRSEAARTLLVANTYDGLLSAAAELLDSVGYEVLGMGPNWTYVPTSPTLSFTAETAGRPGCLLRQQWATSGQDYGAGTVSISRNTLNDPADEPVETSYRRWRVGTRMAGQSMPKLPGHSLQADHAAVVAWLRDTYDPANPGWDLPGFLNPTRCSPDADRPAVPQQAGMVWITSPPEDSQVYVSEEKPDGTFEWKPQDPGINAIVLDVSVPTVREIILARVTAQVDAEFTANPDRPAVMGIDPEDGAVDDAEFVAHRKNPTWYPDYLAAQVPPVPFGDTWGLHGHFGLNQPAERWDPDSQSDAIYGLACWLLREYENASPEPARRALVRAGLYSYNYHDVPPHFNPDPRIIALVAGFPKHRGFGEWRNLTTDAATGRALHRLLPNAPLSEYRYPSNALYKDWGGTKDLPVPFDFSARGIVEDLGYAYQEGLRLVSAEIDFNFGKFGPGYYLVAKMLWNPTMTVGDLDTLRERWLQLAYGNAAGTMKQYHDLMLASVYPVNAQSTWGRAVALIDQAYTEAAGQPAIRRRLDDLKQYWYLYHLFDSGTVVVDDGALTLNPEQLVPDPVRELVWKGQMSYMNAMYPLLQRGYGITDVGAPDPAVAAGPALAAGPAHYTEVETAAWWAQVTAWWPLPAVARFADTTLVDGTPGASVDLNDLTLVDEFLDPALPAGRYFYHSASGKPLSFLTTAAAAGDPIGFQLWWPIDPGLIEYTPRDLAYGLEWWDAAAGVWTLVRDKRAAPQAPAGVTPCTQRGLAPNCHLVVVSVPAPAPGTYRFALGQGGNEALLAPLTYDPVNGVSAGRRALTHAHLAEDSYAQVTGTVDGKVVALDSYLYLPKGTATLDLDMWSPDYLRPGDLPPPRTVHLYPLLPTFSAAGPHRSVDISALQTHHIWLLDVERNNGAIAQFTQLASSFPYVHSVPRLWAMSPGELLVPRAIAAADGLTPTVAGP